MATKRLFDVTPEDLRNARLRALQAGRPFRFRVEGVEAHARIRSAVHFVQLIRLMRENQHFHPAVVEVEKLQRELKARHGVGLPVPEEVWQRPEPSIIIAWGKLTIIAFQGGIGGLVGGTAGTIKRGITDELLAALALRARMQAGPTR